MPEIIKAILLGIVEGLTEFLPVSSTGHLIIVSEALNYTGAEADTFNVFIQLGAILAVLVYFRARFFKLLDLRAHTGFSGPRGIGLLILTTLPALVFGALGHSYIKENFFNVTTVAIGLALGALWILATEIWWRPSRTRELDELTWQIALGIGFFQCIAMVPGMSRSASTILGALYLGMHRRAATEYSFFAAVPMMMAAVSYDLYKSWGDLDLARWWFFAIGFITAFFSALAATRFFIGYVSRYTFIPFAWYRLAVAAVLLWWVA